MNYLLTLFSFLAFSVGAIELPNRNAAKLEVSVECLKREEVVVSVKNAGNASYRVLQMGNSWGDVQFTFLLRTKNGKNIEVVRDRSMMAYTANFPAGVEIKPGAVTRFPISLADKTWKYSAQLLPDDSIASITATLEPRNDFVEDLREYEILLGKWSSPETPAKKWR